MTGISMAPTAQIPVSYHAYLDKLQQKFQMMGKIILDLHNERQIKQAREQSTKVTSQGKFTVGQLVYFLCPAASSLQTNTIKFQARYVGPLVIHLLLDSSHVILKDLEMKLLHGTHHVRRLKPGFVRMGRSLATTIEELRQGMQATTAESKQTCNLCTFVDENDHEVSTPDEEYYLYISTTMGKVQKADKQISDKDANYSQYLMLI